MINLYYRFKNAFRIAVWAFQNPQTVQNANFKMLSDVMVLILKVATDSKPLMTKIACIYPDTKDNMEIVSIWAGSGIGADPYKRIAELNDELSKMKIEMEVLIRQKQIK